MFDGGPSRDREAGAHVLQSSRTGLRPYHALAAELLDSQACTKPAAAITRLAQ